MDSRAYSLTQSRRRRIPPASRKRQAHRKREDGSRKQGFDQESDSTRLFLKERVEECSPYDEIDRTVLYGAYKDWCVFNRINPVSARRLYKSVWEIFRVDTHKLRDRRVFQGLKLVSENANSPQEVAGMAERWQD